MLDDIISKIKEEHHIYVFDKFRLHDEKHYFMVYFREKPQDKSQLKLFSDEYLNSLKVDKYE